MNKKTCINWVIVCMCTLGLMVGGAFAAQKSLKEEPVDRESLKEERERLKKEEFEILSKYFEEHTNYFLEEVPPGLSFGFNEKIRELTVPNYFLFKPNSKYQDQGEYCFFYNTREDALKMLDRMSEEGIEGYCLVSRTLIYAQLEDGTYDPVILEAQKYFEN